MVVTEMKVIEKMIRRKEYLRELVISVVVKDIENLNVIRERQVERKKTIEEQPLLRRIMMDYLINRKMVKYWWIEECCVKWDGAGVGSHLCSWFVLDEKITYLGLMISLLQIWSLRIFMLSIFSIRLSWHDTFLMTLDDVYLRFQITLFQVVYSWFIYGILVTILFRYLLWKGICFLSGLTVLIMIILQLHHLEEYLFLSFLAYMMIWCASGILGWLLSGMIY